MEKTFRFVKDVSDEGSLRVATLSKKLPSVRSKNVEYRVVVPLSGRAISYIDLSPATTESKKWDVNWLPTARVTAYLDNNQTVALQCKLQILDAQNGQRIAMLDKDIKSNGKEPYTFLIDASITDWQRDRGDTSTNPELSWEYWNGKGWWKLGVTNDQTLNLKTTGSVSFNVPADIASSDWAGKTNHWIRARLIGGDYGREKFVTTSVTNNDGSITQTIDRQIDGIRAPAILNLALSYRVCDPVRPGFVLTKDSGQYRDQSDANRMAGAIVEAFIPLAAMLAQQTTTKRNPQSESDCIPTADPQPQTPQAAAVAQNVNSRALYLGLSGVISGANVNVLMLVDEREHGQSAPLKVEALVKGQFVPITTEDTTRALGESGLLSVAFAVPPTLEALFGHSAILIRLMPKDGVNTGDWKPSLRGVYLNAAWACASESITRELLGSSDGAPNMLVRLARPPVLRSSLELRVKEPLGEEERSALQEADQNTVLGEDGGFAGDWVLWKQVVDPGDEAADARVYAFDEATGEIQFGDGKHGLIPPIGRDVIMAFRYKRTEDSPPGQDSAPANAIGARTSLNLISPLESVESVIAADQAAGGAPAESDDRVLRFGYAALRHHKRAVTLRDIEDLTLASSPDIAQARAFAQNGRIRLVVTLRGRNPRPGAAQIRELRRSLLATASPALAAPNALRIEGPQIRRLRLDLTLRVAAFDDAAALQRFVLDRVKALFDTASGGLDGAGWPLGARPTQEEIAAALILAPNLESIVDMTLYEVLEDGSERPWPTAFKASDLAMLDDDPMRVQFVIGEVLS